jgi:hypothetical protein
VLSILNSLAEYLNMMNGKMPSSENLEVHLEFTHRLKKNLEEQLELKYTRGVPWKKYINVASCKKKGNKLLLEPSEKEYIQDGPK